MKLILLPRIFFLLLFLLTPSLLLGQNTSSKKAISELRNQIILWYNPEITIRADGNLCLLKDGTYLVNQVVTPCEKIFINTIETLTISSFLKFERDRATFFVQGLSRYLTLLIVSIQEGALDDYEPYLRHISTISVFLDQVVVEAPEYFSEKELFTSLFSSYEVLLKVFFENIPDEATFRLYQVMVARSDILKLWGYRGEVLVELLAFFYADPAMYIVNKFSHIKESIFPDILYYLEYLGSHEGIIQTNDLSIKIETRRQYRLLWYMSLFCLLCVVSYFIFISCRKRFWSKTSHANLDHPYLNSKERAELRDLRQFFNLHPTEGIETLHKQYRALVRNLHPDMIHDSGESFISFQERYLRAKCLLDRLQEEKTKRFANER